MTTMAYAWLLGIAMVGAGPPEPSLQRFQSSQMQMGVEFKIVLYASDRATANRAFQAAFGRIRQLNQILSDYDPQSELSRLGNSSPSGMPIKVSDDLWRVLQRAQGLSRKTNGAFDVTVGPLTKLWRRARRRKEMPPAGRLAAAKAAVGYEYMQLDAKRHAVRLLRGGMRLDLGGIAKGYAADEALAVLRKFGTRRALVNGSGDIAIGAAPPGKTGWKVSVARLEPKASPSHFLLLANCAIATSGDAWQFVQIEGRRYSHIVDPHSGLGLTDRSSVTIIAPDCLTADSLASAVSVLGPQPGLRLIESTPGAAGLIVRMKNGSLVTHKSSRFKELPAALSIPTYK